MNVLNHSIHSRQLTNGIKFWLRQLSSFEYVSMNVNFTFYELQSSDGLWIYTCLMNHFSFQQPQNHDYQAISMPRIWQWAFISSHIADSSSQTFERTCHRWQSRYYFYYYYYLCYFVFVMHIRTIQSKQYITFICGTPCFYIKILSEFYDRFDSITSQSLMIPNEGCWSLWKKINK